MKAFLAFLKKEWMEQLRSGRLLICGLLFLFMGIMNPATAKMTPWLLELLSEEMAMSGLIPTEMTITALDSWAQFYKNISTGALAFILLQSGIFTREYGSGTLILSLTKGLSRYKVVVAKATMLTGLWSVGYWLCYGVTYAYNAYYWDNAVAQNLLFSAVCWWVLGVWVVALTVLFSVVFRGNIGVLASTGAVVLGCYLIGMLPKCGKYLPTFLTDGTSLVYGLAEPKAYVAALVIAAITAIACFAISVFAFDKKQL